MNVIKSIKQYWTKAMQTLSLTDSTGQMQSLLGQDYKFGTQSKDFLLKAYGINPYVFMVIDRICQRLVQIDKKLIDKNGKEIIDPEFQQLLENPNAKEDGSAFLYRAAATYLATGECFVIRHQTIGEDDEYFVPVNYSVTINQDIKGNVLDYRVSAFGSSEVYLKNEVLHLFKPDITLDSNHGFATLRATRQVWESNNEVWKSEAGLHRNKGVSGVLYSDGNRPMTPTEEKALQEKYDSDYTGSASFGRIKVSTAKMGFTQMGMNPTDLKSIETRIEHLRAICASYNVDSKLFGDPASSTYNNMAEAKRAFIMDAVIPLSKILLPKIIEFMGKSLFQTFTMFLDEDTILELQLTKDQKSMRIGREVLQGLLTAEEGRNLLYPELEPEEGEGGNKSDGSEDDTLEGNPAAETTNAEAQAGLRGSVGGVQGILAIQASVIAGTTPRESAIVILMQIYGFDEPTANGILGEET